MRDEERENKQVSKILEQGGASESAQIFIDKALQFKVFISLAKGQDMKLHQTSTRLQYVISVP